MAKRHTLTGFKTYYRPPVSWLIPGLIKRGGLGFFGGEPKSFKSVLMREIAVCGAAGEVKKMLGCSVTSRCRRLSVCCSSAKKTRTTRSTPR